MDNILEVSFTPVPTGAEREILLQLAGFGPEPVTVTPLPMSRPLGAAMNAWGTRLRLRSLVALGFNELRIGVALGVTRERVTTVVNGTVTEVPVMLARDVVRLWEAWWDKVPPTTTRTQRDAFRRARAKAARRNWCCPLGLDEESIDDPFYIPGAGWLPANGTAVATDPYPLGDRRRAA